MNKLTQFTQKIKKPIVWLILIIGISFVVGFLIFTRGHLWGDDFAGYLLQTKSLVNWNMNSLVEQNQFMNLRSSYSLGPDAYPWGYPLMLVPAFMLFGLSPLALKAVGLFSFLIFLIYFYFLSKKSIGEGLALLASAILAFSPTLLSLNDLIQSDIPFLAITTAGLVLIQRETEEDSLSNKIGIGLMVVLAVFFRTNGILLLVPYSVLIVVQKRWKNRSSLAMQSVPFVIFLFLYFLLGVFFPQGNGSYLEHFSLFSLDNFLYNLGFYLALPLQLFADLPLAIFIAIFFLLFILVYLTRNIKREMPNISFVLATYFLFSLWPERQGLRFILPVLPILLIFSLQGMAMVYRRFPVMKRVLIGLVMLVMFGSLLVSATKGFNNINNGREINGPFDPYSLQMYNFIKAETAVEDVVVFMKPRAFRLFTERNSFMTTQCNDLLFGDVVVLSLKQENNNQISPNSIEECQLPASFSELYKNKRFIVYKINQP